MSLRIWKSDRAIVIHYDHYLCEIKKRWQVMVVVDPQPFLRPMYFSTIIIKGFFQYGVDPDGYQV